MWLDWLHLSVMVNEWVYLNQQPRTGHDDFSISSKNRRYIPGILILIMHEKIVVHYKYILPYPKYLKVPTDFCFVTVVYTPKLACCANIAQLVPHSSHTVVAQHSAILSIYIWWVDWRIYILWMTTRQTSMGWVWSGTGDRETASIIHKT